MVMSDPFYEMNAELADMVGAEDGSHWNPSGHAKGVVLHGADEVDGNLGDLKRPGIGDETEDKDADHLQTDQNGISADLMLFADPAGKGFGNHRTEKIGAHGDQIIGGFQPQAAAKGNRH